MHTTWDVWDTLVARRTMIDARLLHDEHEPAQVLAREQAQCFPIAENVAHVKATDVLVSDYDCPNVVPALVREITGLTNEVVVTNDWKTQGKIWDWLPLRPNRHVGDNKESDGTATKYGVTFEFVEQHKFSQSENYLNDHGFPGCARLMREVRLSTWHEDRTMRNLQLFQSQSNLPMLFLASIALHRKMLEQNFNRVLMSSRDCFLWSKLFETLRPQQGGKYDSIYFWTSRLTRYYPSANYRAYLHRLMENRRVLTIDLCGSGKSLKALLPGHDLWILLSHRFCAVNWYREAGIYEPSNWAQHPMVYDVDADGNPIWANPLGIDWENIPQLKVMHDTFFHAVRVAPLHDFTTDFKTSDANLLNTFREVKGQMDKYDPDVHCLDALSATDGDNYTLCRAELWKIYGKGGG